MWLVGDCQSNYQDSHKQIFFTNTQDSLRQRLVDAHCVLVSWLFKTTSSKLEPKMMVVLIEGVPGEKPQVTSDKLQDSPYLLMQDSPYLVFTC